MTAADRCAVVVGNTPVVGKQVAVVADKQVVVVAVDKPAVVSVAEAVQRIELDFVPPVGCDMVERWDSVV